MGGAFERGECGGRSVVGRAGGGRRSVILADRRLPRGEWRCPCRHMWGERHGRGSDGAEDYPFGFDGTAGVAIGAISRWSHWAMPHPHLEYLQVARGPVEVPLGSSDWNDGSTLAASDSSRGWCGNRGAVDRRTFRFSCVGPGAWRMHVCKRTRERARERHGFGDVGETLAFAGPLRFTITSAAAVAADLPVGSPSAGQFVALACVACAPGGSDFEHATRATGTAAAGAAAGQWRQRWQRRPPLRATCTQHPSSRHRRREHGKHLLSDVRWR